jgi:hypothetical protein
VQSPLPPADLYLPATHGTQVHVSAFEFVKPALQLHAGCDVVGGCESGIGFGSGIGVLSLATCPPF